MPKEILVYPHPLLQKRIKYDPELDDQKVIEQLYEAASKYADEYGSPLLGLAANQIGIETRIVLYEHKGRLVPLINPEIIEYIANPSKVWREREACASLPGVEVVMARVREIRVSLDAYPFAYEWFSDWEARIIQHEVDHLNGTVITDYVD